MKLTIVTICYNDLAGLKATIESLRHQSNFNFEHWVIDGGSKDGSREYLESLQVPWPLKFISEKDRGIYNAMNKGIERATAEFVWFLNSGDFCADETVIARWLDGIEKNPNADVLYGRVWFQGPNGYKSVGRPVKAHHFWSGMALGHQGILYRNSILKQHPYREDLRIVSDWVLTEWFFENTRTAFLSGYFAVFNLEGISATQQGKVFREKLNAETVAWKKIYLSCTLGLKFALIAILRRLKIYGFLQRLRYRSGQITDPREEST